jgi:predicted dinucleotide-binding enzyme
MRIGINGSGNIGVTVASQFISARHDVAIANSRWPGSLTALVGELDDRARAATAEEAAAFGDTVRIAIPRDAAYDLPPEPFVGKVVIDAKHLFPASLGAHCRARQRTDHLLRDGSRPTCPGAHVVKAFNTMFVRLAEPADPHTKE